MAKSLPRAKRTRLERLGWNLDRDEARQYPHGRNDPMNLVDIRDDHPLLVDLEAYR